MKKNFQDSNLTLFGSNNLDLELEDEIRIELFLDNLKLHQVYLETNNPNKLKYIKKLLTSKYLKKLLSLINQWEVQFYSNESEYLM